MAEKLEQLDIDLTIKQVASDDVLKDMEENDQLGANEIIFTKNDTEVPMMPVGSIFASAIPQEDARVRLLDGSTISQTGVYETFANLIKALDSAGQPITCTQDEFNADVSKTGNCGKFVIDNENGTIRLPKITTFIQGLSDITNIGKSLEAGLPSITHTHPQYITANSGSYMGRQDYTSDRSSSDIYPHVNTGTNSAVSSIYGKSNTVQPNATQYPYYIVLASGYKSSQVVDIDNVMDEVNKLNQDYIIENTITSTGGFRKWASGLKEYWGQTTTASADHTITFPEEFSSKNYGVSAIAITDNTASDIITAKVQKGTSNMIVRMRYRSTSAQGNATVNIAYWVKGY